VIPSRLRSAGGRRLGLAALAALVVAGAAACRLAAGPGAEQGQVWVGYGRDQPQVAIRFWYVQRGARAQAAVEREAAAFHRAHPNVRVRAVPLQADTALARIRAAAAGGAAPDASELDTTWVPELTWAGALKPLSPAEVAGAGGRPEFVQAALGSTGPISSPTMTALPWFVDVPAVYYRADALRDLGIDPGQAFASWDSLEATLARLRAAGLTALGIPGRGEAGLVRDVAPWAWGAGGDLVAEDGSAPAIASDASVEGVDRYQGLVAAFADRAALREGPAEVEAGFAAGRYAVTFAGPSLAARLLLPAAEGGLAGEPAAVAGFGTAPLPAGPRARVVPVSGGDLAIWRRSPHQGAAYEWMRWLTAAPAQLDYAGASGSLPVRADLGAGPGRAGDPRLRAFVSELDAGRTYPAVPEWATIQAALAARLATVWDAIAQTGVPLPGARLRELLGAASDEIGAAIRQAARTPLSFACTTAELGPAAADG
jgi:multiple sugar transport system substrate-binding protein